MKHHLTNFARSKTVQTITAGAAMAISVRVTTGISNKFILGSAFVVGMGLVETAHESKIYPRGASRSLTDL